MCPRPRALVNSRRGQDSRQLLPPGWLQLLQRGKRWRWSVECGCWSGRRRYPGCSRRVASSAAPGALHPPANPTAGKMHGRIKWRYSQGFCFRREGAAAGASCLQLNFHRVRVTGEKHRSRADCTDTGVRVVFAASLIRVVRVACREARGWLQGACCRAAATVSPGAHETLPWDSIE